MKKVFIIIIGIVLLIPINVKADDLSLAKNAKSAILIEASTGNIIFEKDADMKLAPASMTKMMSMLLIIESIENNIIKWDQMITVSENASSMGGSQILLETGEKMSVEDLFKGIAIASGNDAVVALAEAIGGSSANFVTMMNKRAKELGLTNTNFKNPHGLDETNHYSSARDMSLIAKELVKHEIVLKYTSIYETYLREKLDTKVWLVNTNKLVRFKEGVDGLKTGYTESAGYCLTATAKKDNMRIIAVVMDEESSTTRNSEASEMLDYAFAQYELETVLRKDSVLGKSEVNKGKDRYVEVVPSKDITFLNKKTDKKINATYKVKVNSIKAPVKKGDVVGKIDVYDDNKKIETLDLTVSKNVKKANIITLYFRNLKDILIGNIEI
ncbi:MAG TPA: D-alanyl-D-alanine carboxypeptidase family protein [Bacilli bacterium]|nr:D-alanyl-D-alanine carboxypeptidase family protein [Bacilli bacterium]